MVSRLTALALMTLLPVAALAADRTVTIVGGQVSAPVGLTVQVKSVTLGEDATTVRLLASFDNHKTTFVNMNDRQNAYLGLGRRGGTAPPPRQIADNKWMRVLNGRTMEGDLVFPRRPAVRRDPADAGLQPRPVRRRHQRARHRHSAGSDPVRGAVLLAAILALPGLAPEGHASSYTVTAGGAAIGDAPSRFAEIGLPARIGRRSPNRALRPVRAALPPSGRRA